MENFSNDFSTTLNGAIDNATTSLTVASATGSPDVQFRIRIDDELMLVTSKGGGLNWTVQRGIEGTTPASHSNGVPVTHILSAAALDRIIAERGMSQIEPEVPTGITRTVLSGTKLVAVDSLDLDGNLIIEGSVVVL